MNDLEQWADYVAHKYHQGLTHQEITSLLVDKGWMKSEAELFVNDILW
jgi:hypothetical protein